MPSYISHIKHSQLQMSTSAPAYSCPEITSGAAKNKKTQVLARRAPRNALIPQLPHDLAMM